MYEVLHSGKSTRAVKGPCMNVVEQRGLGFQVQTFLKITPHVNRVVKEAFGALAFISKGIDNRNYNVLLLLYKCGKTTFGILCFLLVILLYERSH